MFKTIIKTAPASEPVSLEEAKEQLRIESGFTNDDSYISGLISAARDRCENYCNQFFTEQTIEMLAEGAVPQQVMLPYPNLTILSASYTDGDGNLNAIPSADYSYDQDTQVLLFDTTPDAKSYRVEALTAEPAQIVGVQHSIKIIIADLYDLRTETAIGVSLSDNPAVKALLYPYRIGLGL